MVLRTYKFATVLILSYVICIGVRSNDILLHSFRLIRDRLNLGINQKVLIYFLLITSYGVSIVPK